jgi:hypothetical protein
MAKMAPELARTLNVLRSSRHLSIARLLPTLHLIAAVPERGVTRIEIANMLLTIELGDAVVRRTVATKESDDRAARRTVATKFSHIKTLATNEGLICDAVTTHLSHQGRGRPTIHVAPTEKLPFFLNSINTALTEVVAERTGMAPEGVINSAQGAYEASYLDPSSRVFAGTTIPHSEGYKDYLGITGFAWTRQIGHVVLSSYPLSVIA